jgi:hypothetical protein
MFATFNISKIKTSQELRARYKHNRRIGKISKNVNQQNMNLNHHGKNDIAEFSEKQFRRVQAMRTHAGANLLRKNTVPAVELVLGASSEFFIDKSEKEIIAWGKTQIDWAKEYYKDRGKYLGFDFHLDEKTPHIHIMFAPIVSKLDKKTGKQLDSYSAKEFVGNKSEMNRARTSHAEANEYYGLVRGKNYHEAGETPPDYTDSIKELRRQTKDAKAYLEGLDIDDIKSYINDRFNKENFAKELREACAAHDAKDKEKLIEIASRPKPKRKPWGPMM